MILPAIHESPSCLPAQHRHGPQPPSQPVPPPCLAEARYTAAVTVRVSLPSTNTAHSHRHSPCLPVQHRHGPQPPSQYTRRVHGAADLSTGEISLVIQSKQAASLTLPTSDNCLSYERWRKTILRPHSRNLFPRTSMMQRKRNIHSFRC